MTNSECDDKKVSDNDTKDKLARLVDLPSLPALLMDALQHTADNQSLSHLADKIGQDPPMVVRILRIINSPFYGMPREIGSLREAVVLLGLNRVRDILLSACVMNILPAQNKDFDYPLFWRHCLAVADCARQLGMHTRIGPDIAFTAGLLHDIGRLVIVLLFPNDAGRLIKEPQPICLDTERRIMGFDHVEIGSKVAQYWNLPLAIQEAIEQHETPPTQAASTSLGLLIYTANLLVKQTEQNNDDISASIIHVLELLGIPLEQATLWADTSRQFADQIIATL
jgi:putative nucleotidyltransferase with HDIG domain